LVSSVSPSPLHSLTSRWKRIARGSLQIPFGIAAGIGLAAVLTLIFAVEVFMSEVYNGPFKQFLVRRPIQLELTIGVHPDCLIFDFDSYFLGNLHANLESVDKLRKPSHGPRLRKRLNSENIRSKLLDRIHVSLPNSLRLRYLLSSLV